MNFAQASDSIYNPANFSKEELIARFIVRKKLFQKLFKDIKEQANSETPPEHLLIVGLRGMGKTTLLLRLAYEIEEDQSLNAWLLLIRFSEEQYGVRNLYKF